ncbi:glycosyltransferase family 2 protein [Microbacterium sp. RD1]|uniref:glycosyltransferase family 2 protein n=1 Tax=Microbacterium sp. RD1 TaxID=3457313 RepID=UPI003FA5D9BA
MLDYDVVVATRNRLEMLWSTLPLFAAQSRPPRRIIVVDRSDDHEAVRAMCGIVESKGDVPIEVHFGEAANLPAQRNQGIDRVGAAVTMLPDDDSMWYPDTAARVLEVYEADPGERYGAVTAVDAYSPPGDDDTEAPLRRTRLTDRPAVMRLRNAVEAAVVPQPFELYGRARVAELSVAARAAGLTHRYVGTLGGYRMTFRSEVLRRLRFDPVLGSRVGYGTHEDKDMALRVLRDGLLIAVAEDARVFHNVHPGKRAGGFEYGFFHILNYAYTSRKVMPDDSAALRAVRRYLGYKVWLYSLRRGDVYDRQVYRGGRAALSVVTELLATSPDELAVAYGRLCDRVLTPMEGKNG